MADASLRRRIPTPHPARDPILGTTIGGRFKVIDRVGVGGMGTVYRAVQSPLGREIALKILKEEVTWDPETVTRFHREAKAMSLLVHPNTVRVFDFGQTDDGMLFLAMELLEGELLTSKLDREGLIEVSEAIRITYQMLASLAEAHSKGIVHRDLKPDNIYLARVQGHPVPVVKVLDFGIAKLVQGEQLDQLETQAGTVFGTPRYMSPEQAQGKTLDARSDLYAVGVLLYQLLTGQPPFVDDDAVIVMAKHIRERPVPPLRVVPEQPIPPSLNRLVMKAIEKDPQRRFQSAEQMMMALDVCLDEVGTAELRTGTFDRLGRRLRVVPAWSWIVLTAAIAFIVGGVAWATAEEPAPIRTARPSISREPRPAKTRSAEVAILLSVPEGAEVFHEGASLGHTPLRLEMVPGRQMEVSLQKEGYDEATGQLVADARTRTVILTPESEGEEAAEPQQRPSRRTQRRAAHVRRARRSQMRAAAMRQDPRPTKTSEPASMDAPPRDPYYERFD